MNEEIEQNLVDVRLCKMIDNLSTASSILLVNVLDVQDCKSLSRPSSVEYVYIYSPLKQPEHN